MKFKYKDTRSAFLNPVPPGDEWELLQVIPDAPNGYLFVWKAEVPAKVATPPAVGVEAITRAPDDREANAIWELAAHAGRWFLHTSIKDVNPYEWVMLKCQWAGPRSLEITMQKTDTPDLHNFVVSV